MLRLALVLALLTPDLSFAAGKSVIAVFDVQVQRVQLDKRALNALTDYVAAEIAAAGVFEIVPRAEIKRTLAAQKKSSYQSCIDERCQIEIGKELAAEKSLATQVLKLGKQCVVTLTLYDLKKATNEQAVTAKGGCTESNLTSSLENAVAKLAKSAQGEPPPPPPPQVKIPAVSATLLGVGTDFQLWTRPPQEGWSARPVAGSCCVMSVAHGSSGQLVGVGSDLQLWTKDTKAPDSKWTGPLKSSCCVKSIVLHDGVLLGVDTLNRIWKKQSADLESPWIGPLQNSCCVQTLAVAIDGRLLAIGTQNQLWIKASRDIESAWTGPLQNSCCVRAVALDSDGILLGIDTQNGIWKKASHDLESAWLGPVPQSCCVTSVMPAR